MHKINFINPLSKNDMYQIRRWIHFTIVMASIISIGGGIMIGVQWHIYTHLQSQLKNLKNQLGTYDTVMDMQRKTKQEQELFKKKIAKLHRCQHNPKNPITIIDAIATVSKQCSIESLVIKKEHLELTLVAPNTVLAMDVVKSLQASPLFKNVYLQSLQHNDRNQATIFIKGTILS